jgi:hypothetical protein
VSEPPRGRVGIDQKGLGFSKLPCYPCPRRTFDTKTKRANE